MAHFIKKKKLLLLQAFLREVGNIFSKTKRGNLFHVDIASTQL